MDDKKSFDVETKQKTELDTLNNNIVFVNAGLKSIVRGFYNVGKVLNELKNSESYKLLGYNNFFDFTKSQFDLSKSQSSKLVNIFNKFPSNKYSDFTFSQLSEMLSLPSDKVEEITSDMTIKQIRQVKKDLKEDEVIKKKDKIDFGKQVDIVDVLKDEELGEELINVADEIERLESANKILKNRKESLEIKHENLKRLSRDKDNEINDLKGRIDFAKSSIDNITKRDNKLINDLKNENEKLKKENEKLKKERDKLKKEKQEIKENKKDLPFPK